MTEQAKGAANRARVAEALKIAGPAGMRCSEIAEALQMDERTLRYYLVTNPVNVLKGATKSHEFTRWFHVDYPEAAAEYVRVTNIRERRAIRVSDDVIERACAFIKGGETQAQASEAIGKSRSATATALKALVDSGRVQAEKFPADMPTGGLVVRYWPTGVEVPAVPERPPRQPKKRIRVRVRPKKAKAPKPGRQLVAKPSGKPQEWKPKAPVQIIIPANVKRTACPSCTDTRFTVHEVQPYFSAMKPGQYDNSVKTWAAAVYGGGV